MQQQFQLPDGKRAHKTVYSAELLPDGYGSVNHSRNPISSYCKHYNSFKSEHGMPYKKLKKLGHGQSVIYTKYLWNKIIHN